ncbi:MAG: phage antirepressor KilAC domain-containing protein [Streptococcus hyointestinalis]|nr:phage antirepressor KilAC domain-containing protein [Streptococcus hyointestinalis]MDD6385177.1 phage antirepressor KilAC domain-containing protein [Streptococcus hyointestinalis]
MNNLISVNLNENNEPVVSGRQLHKALGVKTKYADWFNRMVEYGFTENQDFNLLKIEQVRKEGSREVKRTIQDHVLKLDMAKEIAMIQRTDKGKEVRQYFIQVEEEFNSPDKIIARALLLSNDKVLKLESRVEFLEAELEEAQKQARYLDLIIESKASLRVTQIAADYGMSAHKFNKLLHDLGVQHKVNGQWILYKRHMGKGYTDSATFDFMDNRGQARTHITTTWTQKGRLFLYELLKENGILPLIERDEEE